MKKVIALFFLFFALSSVAAEAQDWAKAMFNAASYNFGVIARGAKAEYRFTIENIYEEDAHITSVSSSCGCTTPKLIKDYLKTWEKTEIVVTVDTRREPGNKQATITVRFDKPFPAEVQLHVYSYIRGDVVVQPGSIEFGAVRQGTDVSRTVKVTYAGRSDWKILNVENANPSVETKLVETRRAPGQLGFEVDYDLTVRVKPDALPGYLSAPLILVTNDANAQTARVPVAIEGLVESVLSVRPSPLLLGVAEVGQSVTRYLVVQGREPFHIRSIRSSDPRFRCLPPMESKSLHTIPVTFLGRNADTTPGTVTAKLRIETDLAGAAATETPVSIKVVSPKSP